MRPTSDPTRMSIEIDTQTGGSIDNSDETETIENPQRGCGYMEDGKAYLKTDVAPGGELPAFVVFDQAIPFKENRKRSYTRFPGIQFELSVTGDGGMTETEPEGEVWDHLNRLSTDRPTGETAGEMIEFQSQDLLLSVGKTHYPDVEDFVNEARVHGVSKAISVTSGNQPPEVDPGRTRLFLIHPNAVDVEREIETTAGEMNDDDEVLVIQDGDLDADHPADLADDVQLTVQRELSVPGVFGYTYLTRVIYTEDADGNVPAYIQEYDTLGDLDVVKTGRETPYSDQINFSDDGNLDTEAVLAGLEEAEDEIREFAANTSMEECPALVAPTIETMEKAPYGELVEEGTIEAMRPPEGEDHFQTGEGALAVLSLDNQQYKVVPTNILSVDGESRTATTQVGPYKVEVTDTVGGAARTVRVENTR